MSGSFTTMLQDGYRVLWKLIVLVLRVPDSPPALPAAPGSAVESFRPSKGFLRYLKLWFWIAAIAIDLLLLVAWIAILIAVPVLGLILLLPFLAISVLPDIVGYVAVHLRVDSTWYVISDRSMRLRRGIWFLHETTITFENVQDVAVSQGPIERYFGIAHVTVKTAGGGGGQPGQAGGHLGLLEGLDNAHHVRDLILSRIRASRAAGLGDERSLPGNASAGPQTPWTPDHLATLREIRDLAAAIGARAG